MRTHHQRRFFYASTVGLLIMYTTAIILLILSFGGCAVGAEYHAVGRDAVHVEYYRGGASGAQRAPTWWSREPSVILMSY
jgi:hypothetical protein